MKKNWLLLMLTFVASNIQAFNPLGSSLKDLRSIGHNITHKNPHVHKHMASTDINEEKIKQADALIKQYLKMSDNNSLTEAEREHVMMILGRRTVCPRGQYLKTCGQISCTETEVICQCLNNKGELKQASASASLKPYQQLVNVNGKLKVETINVAKTGHYANIPTHIRMGKTFTLKQAFGRPFDSWKISVESGKQHLTVLPHTNTLAAHTPGKAVITLTGTIGEKILKATKVIIVTGAHFSPPRHEHQSWMEFHKK